MSFYTVTFFFHHDHGLTIFCMEEVLFILGVTIIVTAC